jgi:formamidopyrimidine-DNA glycosylase
VHIDGQTIDDIRLLHPALRRRTSRTVLRALRGARISHIERRGKHQLIHLEDGRVVHVHFRMNGDWVFDRSSDPLPRFARALFSFTDGTRVVLEDSRALSTLDVHAADAPLSLDLGPEPQDPAFTPALLHAALVRRRIAIKPALLDQRIIAGLGNIYASEALWRAKIDPRAISASLSPASVRQLLQAIRVVIARATGGRYTDQDGAQLDAYDREGESCRRCRGTIARLVQGSRSTYFCPRCQRIGRPKISRAPRSARS